MEKYYIFGFIAVCVLIIVFKFIFKSKSASWKGTVLKKKSIQGNDSHNITKEIFSVTVKTENNKEINVTVSKILWNNIKEGDTIEKKKGEPYPKKI